MTPIYTYDLDPLEQSLTAASCILAITDSHPTGTAYVVIGTGYVIPNETDVSRGRLLVFDVERGSDDRYSVSLLCEREVKGAVFAVTSVRDKIAAAINHKVRQTYSHLLFNLTFTFYIYMSSTVVYIGTSILSADRTQPLRRPHIGQHPSILLYHCYYCPGYH